MNSEMDVNAHIHRRTLFLLLPPPPLDHATLDTCAGLYHAPLSVQLHRHRPAPPECVPRDCRVLLGAPHSPPSPWLSAVRYPTAHYRDDHWSSRLTLLTLPSRGHPYYRLPAVCRSRALTIWVFTRSN